MPANEKLPVKSGEWTHPKRMTRAQALRWGNKNMPQDLKRAGFTCIINRSDAEMHGGTWFRVNYGK